MTTTRRPTKSTKHERAYHAQSRGDATQFILREAVCKADAEDGAEEDEDVTDTDLSGFIVDDDAESEVSSRYEGRGRTEDRHHPLRKKGLDQKQKQDVGLDLASDLDSEDGLLNGDGTREKRRRRRLVRGARNRNRRRSKSWSEEEDKKREVEQQGSTHPKDLIEMMAAMVPSDKRIEKGFRRPGQGATELEVIDLTSSPINPQRASSSIVSRHHQEEREHPKDWIALSESEDAAHDKEAILRFSPPTRKSPFKVERKGPEKPGNKQQKKAANGSSAATEATNFRHPEKEQQQPHTNTHTDSARAATTTPPHTPPTSPRKLASPNKLTSPTKHPSTNPLLLSPTRRHRQPIPQSPHRPSLDAFWSSEVINEWNDQYSPVKDALRVGSPTRRKKIWQIWEEEEEEQEEEDEEGENEGGEGDDVGSGSGSGSESPSESPARRRTKTNDRKISPPQKGTAPPPPPSPQKQQRTQPSSSSSAAATRKQCFRVPKTELAHALLKELDERISDGQLAELARSTGGVKIIWSKNLRSTAGRANWRRVVVKKTAAATNSALALASASSDQKGKGEQSGRDEILQVPQTQVWEVHHHASIELAEKVIDDEERLVNTLAHEFCHLANFMVSGVRDQPHGVSFKNW